MGGQRIWSPVTGDDGQEVHGRGLVVQRAPQVKDTCFVVDVEWKLVVVVVVVAAAVFRVAVLEIVELVMVVGIPIRGR